METIIQSSAGNTSPSSDCASLISASAVLTSDEWQRCLQLAYRARDAYQWTAHPPCKSVGKRCSMSTPAKACCSEIDCADGELTVFRGAGVAAAILSRSDETIIALPGSLLEPHDWVANFDARQNVVPGLGRCHFGFWNYADALFRNFIEPHLSRQLPARQPIYLTGHSQGGAVAGLVAHFLRRRGWSPALTATFGAPRFLHPEALRQYQPRLIGFRNRGDLIPRLPLGWRYRYATAGQTIELPIVAGNASKYRWLGKRLVDTADWFRSLFASFAGDRHQRPHAMHAYITGLEESLGDV